MFAAVFRVILLIVLIVFAITVEIAYNYYVFFENDGNHTSAPLDVIGFGFLSAAVGAGISAYKCSGGIACRLWAVASVVTALTAANILLFSWLHVMMFYETWVKGMPERPAWSLPAER